MSYSYVVQSHMFDGYKNLKYLF